jgi:Protein of unknown function (DUF2637)
MIPTKPLARIRTAWHRLHHSARPAPAPRPPADFMTGYRRYALRAVALIVTAATAVALSESYRSLYLWALHHGVPGRWAFAWPATVDSFVVVGELALFIGLIDGWSGRYRAWAWLVTFGGLAVSVAGNIGHVGPAPWADRLTAAVPPIAAFVALTVALGVLKRVAALAVTSAAILAAKETEVTEEATAQDQTPAVDLVDISRRAVLGAAEVDAQRVRYAIAQGCQAAVGPVREWLAFYGHDVSEVNIMSVIRRLNGNGNSNGNSVRGMNDSGELETLTA